MSSSDKEAGETATRKRKKIWECPVIQFFALASLPVIAFWAFKKRGSVPHMSGLLLLFAPAHPKAEIKQK